MSEEPIGDAPEGIARYSPSEARLAEMQADFFNQFEIEKRPDPRREGHFILAWKAPLTGKDDPRFPAVMASLKQLTTCRTQLEQARQHFKREHLIAGRKIDSDAAALNSKILAIEGPIRAEKDRVEAEARAAAEAIVRAQEEKAAAEAKRLADEEAARKRAEEERLEAERKRLADERAAFEAQQAEAKRIADEATAKERERLEAEAAERKRKQDAIDAEHARQKAELEAQAAKLRAEQEAIEREKREKEIREQAAKEAKEKAEREAELFRLAEEKKKADAEAAERAAKEALPDIEKIHGFGCDLQMGLATLTPRLATEKARTFLEAIVRDVETIIERCKTYGTKGKVTK